ncbi:MAG TPA: ThuA domain-containing protein, partial [Gemmataceae bacterium]|nr:ThuA domain-containing protein [Gemmataceae bacterium]
WRYHPLTKEFELFAEGGGNTWGLDFDAHGNAIAGTNFGNVVCLHQVQGGYYVKNFSKHGELQNPYAFGYFEHVPYQGFKGGHVTCGGILYQGGAFPKEFEQVYIAANPLANAVYWHRLEPKRSSFTARFGGDMLLGNDTWFRPIDLLVGPDGSLFVADWYDKRINHVDPVDNWDRTNGRIYRVAATGTQPVTGLPLSKRSSAELVGLLGHPNDWFVREARRILAERRDPAVWPVLRRMLLERTDSLALQALWALYVSDGWDEPLAERLLSHANADVRTWTIRLLGDAKKVAPAIKARLTEMARTETSCTVRSQLACTCKRLPGKDALPILRSLFEHPEDADDPHIPLLLWWAIEDKAVSDREQVVQMLEPAAAWQNRLIRQFIVERLGRRYMAAGTEADLQTCARLLALAPGAAEADLLVRGMEKALDGRRLASIPIILDKQLAVLWSKQEPTVALLRLGLRLNQDQAYERALSFVRTSKRSTTERISLIEVLGQIGNPRCVPDLLSLLADTEPPAIRMAALSALQPFPDPTIAATVLARYAKMPSALRSRAQTLLCSRPASTRAFLEAVDRGQIGPQEVSFDQVRRILLHNDAEVRRLVEKHWGKIGQEPPGERRARINSVKHMLGTGKGDPTNGKQLFQAKCATCHTLFGEGANIGPDLTGTDRRDRDFLVTSVVDPSAVIRNEYVAYVVATNNGRVLNGLIREATPQAITLVDAKNELATIARHDIEEMKPSPQSLMPEKLLDDLDEQQIRDLFAYLQSGGPAVPARNQKPESAAQGKKENVLTVCLVSGSLEYQSDESLRTFQKYLEEHFPIRCTRAFRKTDDDLPGLENLDTCDVMLLFTRRLTISGKQLERIQKYCRSGKPIVAVRTASHAFQNWLALDKEILGGNYQGHYPEGPVTKVSIVEKAKNHPILAGVTPFESVGSLYKNIGRAADVDVLLTGSIPEHTEPIAWTRIHNGGRVFYTSLGHPKDFQNSNFQRLLANALLWTSNRKSP